MLLNKGNGTFKEALYLKPGGTPACPVVADFNHDGKPDITVSDAGEVLIYLGTGKSSLFEPPLSIAMPGSYCLAGADLTGLSPFSVIPVIADFNGDKLTDLALVDPFNNTVYILLNRGRGTFNLTSFETSETGGCGYAIAADVNGDGKTDLICSTDTTEIELYLGNGDGTFSAGTKVPDPLFNGYGLLFTDLNGDGIPDIGQVNSESFGVFLGNGDGARGSTIVT